MPRARDMEAAWTHARIRRRRREMIVVAALLIAGGAALAASRAVAAQAAGIGLLSLAGVLAASFAFYEIGVGEDEDRAREQRRR